jgi:MEMO1 family protein
MAPSQNLAVRPSAIAGSWYPGRPEALRQAIEGYLSQVQPADPPGPVHGQVLALVAPHAGYAYSGPTAAHAYAQVRGATYDRVILLGPLHRPIYGSRLGAFMVPAEEAYATPLGQVPVDRAFIEVLAQRVPLTRVQRDAEHSLEIQLPFLQVALAAPFSLVPIMLGEHIADPGAANRIAALAVALADLVQARAADYGEKALLVASTDLSHLDNYADVVRVDHQLVDLVANFAVPELAEALAEERVQACGATGLVTALEAAQHLGAKDAAALAYAASGDVTGDKRPGTYTVGYLAAAAYG